MKVLGNRELNKDLLGELLSVVLGLFTAVRLMFIKDTGLKLKLESETVLGVSCLAASLIA